MSKLESSLTAFAKQLERCGLTQSLPSGKYAAKTAYIASENVVVLMDILDSVVLNLREELLKS